MRRSSADIARSNEGLNHFGVDEVAIELVELAEPKVIAVEI